jgi:hypothetical protein
MIFKLLEPKRTDGDKETNQQSPKPAEPDPKLLIKLALQQAADKQGVSSARLQLSEAYRSFLGQLNTAYQAKNASQRIRVEANYQAWAAFFELLKKNFKEAWDFFGVVQEDVEGWYRVAPAGKEVGLIALGKEGYSFAAGVEQNTSRGVPFPKKWLTVTLAHSTSFASGIGDERMIGRVGLPDNDLVGLEKCTGKSGDVQEEAAEELCARITRFPLVFTLSSESRGQHTTAVPISVLETHTITELCQPLLVALTNDDLKPMKQLLPFAEQLKLK